MAPSVLEEMHRPQVVKARSPRKGMFQSHNPAQFASRTGNPLHPGSGGGGGGGGGSSSGGNHVAHNGAAAAAPVGTTRTTGFCLTNTSQYIQQQQQLQPHPNHQQQHQQHQMQQTLHDLDANDEMMMDTSTSVFAGASHYYAGNYPLPPHL